MIFEYDDKIEAMFVQFNIFSPNELAGIFTNELSKALERFSMKKRLEAQVQLSSKATLGLESVQKRRTLFCFCSCLDNNQGGVNTFKLKCNLATSQPRI